MSIHNVRRVDIGLLVLGFTLMAMVWAGFKVPASWDRAVVEVNKLEPKVDDHEKRLVVLETTLADMKDDVKYIRRHTRP